MGLLGHFLHCGELIFRVISHEVMRAGGVGGLSSAFYEICITAGSFFMVGEERRGGC